MKKIIWGIVITVILISIPTKKYIETKGYEEEYIEKAYERLAEYGIENASVRMIRKGSHGGYPTYTLRVDISGEYTFSDSKIYDLVSKIKGIRIGSAPMLVLKEVYIDGIEYSIYEGQLRKDGKAYYGEKTYRGDYGGNCLAGCGKKAETGKDYCSRHSCCQEDCTNRKDVYVHCCKQHSCQAAGCGRHKYVQSDKYCNIHYVKQVP